MHPEVNKFPNKAKKNEQNDGSLGDVYAVQKPFSGCKQASLVTPFNPVVGISMDQLPHDQVHGVYPDKDVASSVANQLYEKHCEMEEALEEKKIKVTEKLKRAMGNLEKMRNECMGLIKENPREAREEKQKVAQYTQKIDELMMKLEKIELSKKQIEKKDPKKKELKEGTLADFKKNVNSFKSGNIVDTQLKTFYSALKQKDKDTVKADYSDDEEVAKVLAIPKPKTPNKK